MSIPLLTTKLYMPVPRPDLVPRPRLVEKLDAGLRGRLTLISAPAGYGKTTLLSAWLSQLDRSMAWLSLDEADNEFPQFFDYLIAAMQSAIPTLGKSIPTLRSTPGPPPIQELMTSLVNEILGLPEKPLLILDDYHVISAGEVHRLVMLLLENLPPNLHLVIASRTDPPLPLARWRARAELSEVRAKDLRFTQLEVIDFLNGLLGLGLSSSDIRALTEKTEGWIAGLQLAGISLQGHQDRGAFVRTFAGDDRHIADYLFEEVLNGLPEYLQTFLLETSICDQLCASLCHAVTGRDDSQAILLDLEHANLFLVPQDNRRQWYRYHHLFSDLLYLYLKKRSPFVIPALHGKASEWFESQGFLNQAVTHAIKSGDIRRLENLVQSNTLAMLEVGESNTVIRWLNSLPQDTVEKSPWLTVARGWALLFSGDVKAAEAALMKLETTMGGTLGDNAQNNRAFGQIAAIRSYIADLKGDQEKVEGYAREALDKLPEDDHLAVAFASMMLATAYNRRGDPSGAEIALQGALNLVEIMPYSFAAIEALCMLSKVQYIRGQLHESAATLKRALEMSRQNSERGDRPFPIMGFVHVYQGQLLLEWYDLEEALSEVNLGLKMLEPWGYVDCTVVGLGTLALIHHALGNQEQVSGPLEKARNISRDLPYWFDTVVAIETWLIALQGNMPGVSEWLTEQRGLMDHKLENHHGSRYRYLAKTLLALGKIEEAADWLRKIYYHTEKHGSTGERIRVLVLLSVALFRIGNHDEAFIHFKSALELAEPGGYVRVFIEEGEPAARLLYQAAQKGVHKAYCLKLLSQFSKPVPVTPGVSTVAEDLIEPLSDREVEVLGHIARGLTNQEIAGELILSLYTVKSHARNIYSKLGVKNRTEAVARARLLGLLPQT